MFLSKYITNLQAMLDEHGDTDLLFTAADEEGSGYSRAGYAPEFRFIRKDDKYRPDQMIEPQQESQTQEDWLDENCLDEEDIPNLVRVILL